MAGHANGLELELSGAMSSAMVSSRLVMRVKPQQSMRSSAQHSPTASGRGRRHRKDFLARKERLSTFLSMLSGMGLPGWRNELRLGADWGKSRKSASRTLDGRGTWSRSSQDARQLPTRPSCARTLGVAAFRSLRGVRRTPGD